MLLQDFFGFVIGAVEDAFDFGINFLSSEFAAVALERTLSAGQVESVLALGDTDEANTLAHAEEAHHLAGDGGGMFEIVLGAGGNLVQNDIFGGAATEHAANAVEELGTGHEEMIVAGQLHGVAEGPASARDDADFVDGV